MSVSLKPQGLRIRTEYTGACHFLDLLLAASGGPQAITSLYTEQHFLQCLSFSLLISFVHAFYLLSLLFFQSFIRSCINSSVLSFAQSFIHWFTCLNLDFNASCMTTCKAKAASTGPQSPQRRNCPVQQWSLRLYQEEPAAAVELSNTAVTPKSEDKDLRNYPGMNPKDRII